MDQAVFANDIIHQSHFKEMSFQATVSCQYSSHLPLLLSFSVNSSLFLLTESPCRILFVCLNPVNDFQDFWLSLFVQSLTHFLAIPVELPQAGLGPMKGLSNPNLANWSVLTLIRLWLSKICYFNFNYSFAPTENSSSVLFSVWHTSSYTQECTWHGISNSNVETFQGIPEWILLLLTCLSMHETLVSWRT